MVRSRGIHEPFGLTSNDSLSEYRAAYTKMLAAINRYVWGDAAIASRPDIATIDAQHLESAKEQHRAAKRDACASLKQMIWWGFEYQDNDRRVLSEQFVQIMPQIRHDGQRYGLATEDDADGLLGAVHPTAFAMWSMTRSRVVYSDALFTALASLDWGSAVERFASSKPATRFAFEREFADFGKAMIAYHAATRYLHAVVSAGKA